MNQVMTLSSTKIRPNRLEKQKILITTVVTKEETTRLTKGFNCQETRQSEQSEIYTAKPIFESVCCRSNTSTIKIFTRATPLVVFKMVTSLPFSCSLPCSSTASVQPHRQIHWHHNQTFLHRFPISKLRKLPNSYMHVNINWQFFPCHFISESCFLEL